MTKQSLFRMSCKKCGYVYSYQGVPYPYEKCPICGHGAEFKEFVDRGEKSK